ncbi:transcription antitermination factor NusB [Ruminococcaceae bacterium OttesenSCG-928-I18]|nr:transcription antitermination factor NusB [Ruminococcaceae bacterium OttesenSCG-928-I18]
MEKPNRRNARENAFIRLFALAFPGAGQDDVQQAELDEEYPLDTYIQACFCYCVEHLEQIDSLILPKLKSWTLERLPKVSLTILRLATAELLFGGEDGKEMDSIVINEAVELAKKYGDGEDYQFINGVLGSIVREQKAGS